MWNLQDFNKSKTKRKVTPFILQVVLFLFPSMDFVGKEHRKYNPFF